MPLPFLCDDFLLTTECARRLYHEYAAEMPIFDYHCHLPPAQIAGDTSFPTLSAAWLVADHYKWRAMRTNGVDERFCTGDAPDREKFLAWADTVPATVGNPLFIWTHLELRRYFGIESLLNPATAAAIYETCTAKLAQQGFSVRNLLRRMKVRGVCTTDDPIDNLAHHHAIARSGFEIAVLPTFRPDKCMNAHDPVAWNRYIDSLSAAADVDVRSWATLVEALGKRHDAFNEAGCRLSDHGLETAYAREYTEAQVSAIVARIRGGAPLNEDELLVLRSALLFEFARMDAHAGWVQQLHLGALRNNNSRQFAALGPDTGFDSIGDYPIGVSLSRYLDRLDSHAVLPKTILYTLNPGDNELLATMAGNFQGASIAGKIQSGSAWWFHDQRDGMERQLTALANMGLLSCFVGMLTDSRSFLSYPRHEYFRRILCRQIAAGVELGEIPCDYGLLGPMVRNICYNNACTFVDSTRVRPEKDPPGTHPLPGVPA